MVSAFPMQSYYRPTPLTVDTAHAQQKFFEEDEASILDENILDQSAIDSGLEMSPAMVDSRRESFAVGAPLFSLKQEDWHAVDMQSVPSNNPFLDQPPHQQLPHQSQPQSNNPFMRMDQGNFAPQCSWPPMTASTPASAGSMQAFDGLPAEFDANGAALIHRSPIPFSNPTNHVTMFSSVGSQPSLPNSPQKEHWSGNMSMNKKMRPNSPAIRSHNELRKGDGIRKKNARFEIPAERNLSNIDDLIAQSTDEQEIKELKQQKRLLRNRQAALDSRQRKKQHTEALEDEKKSFISHVGVLQDEIEDMRLQIAQLMHEKAQLNMHIECLTFEKDEMIARHTMETGELRKKIKVISSHLEEVSASSSMPGMNGGNPAHSFPGAPFAEMEGLSMDGSWDGMGFMGDFPPMELPQQQQPQQPVVVEVKREFQQQKPVQAQQPEMQMVVGNKKLDTAEVEKPTSQGGLLFMLFLVGALVCSSRSAAPSIPRVSEDVRVASATILENVMKDAGVANPSSQAFGLSAPQPSPAASAPSSAAIAWPDASTAPSASMLDAMSESLTQPTAEQTKEQLFSMSAAQYNGMTSQDFLHQTDRAAAAQQQGSGGRRNLAEALASMGHGSKAEVYTRSLLWDQIPGDVVKNFVKMVAQCSSTNQNEAGATEDVGC